MHFGKVADMVSLMFLTTCVYSSGDLKDKLIEFDFGGTRQAKVTLTIGKDDYLVKVTMKPIKVFDNATNNLLNSQKARELGYLALAKHLSDKDSVVLIVSGAVALKDAEEAKTYSLTLRVPRDGVSLGKEEREEAAMAKETAKGIERIAVLFKLETCKQDYEKTIQMLDRMMLSELKKCQREKDMDKFEAALGKIKKRGLDNWQQMETKIKNELLLFSTEQTELVEAISRRRGSLMAQVEEAIRLHRKKEQEDKKP